ncbi:hypothetical protein [Novacetimonas cocois]|uniref:hypothetical protein n=1 Tax=Novacetimonas cocois TaxID=1747507 RepID=UPI0010581FFC|nr:hypothetical protein [Novacetimonas cocois]
MTTQGPKRQKLRGIIRLELRRIEDLMRTGCTIESIAKMFSEEMGIPINARSFRNGLSLVRKECREKGENWIAQSNIAPVESPAPAPEAAPKPTTVETPAKPPEPPRPDLGNAGDDSPEALKRKLIGAKDVAAELMKKYSRPRREPDPD